MRGILRDGGRRSSFGLGTRVTAAFAVGALVLSAALAAITYQLARTYLLRQRDTSVVRQALVNARLVGEALEAARPEIPRLLASLERPSGSHVVVHTHGQWFAGSLAVGRDGIPVSLRRDTLAGHAGRQRFRAADAPRVAVGVPIGDDAAYFEVFALAEVQRTLTVLRNSAIAAGGLTTLAGAAVGKFMSRRLLRPVADVAAAAAAVGEGNLDIRLDAGGDPDLDVMAAAFNRMTDALRERIRRDARFAAAVSHELRSPLMTLASSLEVALARRDEMPDRARAALDLLADEVQRFQRLVADLLEVSRLDAGAVEPVFEDVRFGAFVLHAVQSLPYNVSVDVADAAAQTIVSADKRRLERVIANLIDNAEHHGGGVVRVVAEIRMDVARVIVEDAGPGVAADERDHIFERFVRGTGSRRSDGSGLGLSLVREYMALHNGEVHIEDRAGGGARFVVELRRADT